MAQNLGRDRGSLDENSYRAVGQGVRDDFHRPRQVDVRHSFEFSSMGTNSRRYRRRRLRPQARECPKRLGARREGIAWGVEPAAAGTEVGAPSAACNATSAPRTAAASPVTPYQGKRPGPGRHVRDVGWGRTPHRERGSREAGGDRPRDRATPTAHAAAQAGDRPGRAVRGVRTGILYAITGSPTAWSTPPRRGARRRGSRRPGFHPARTLGEDG